MTEQEKRYLNLDIFAVLIAKRKADAPKAFKNVEMFFTVSKYEGAYVVSKDNHASIRAHKATNKALGKYDIQLSTHYYVDEKTTFVCVSDALKIDFLNFLNVHCTRAYRKESESKAIHKEVNYKYLRAKMLFEITKEEQAKALETIEHIKKDLAQYAEQCAERIARQKERYSEATEHLKELRVEYGLRER